MMMMARVRRQRGNIAFYAAVVVLSVIVALVISEVVKLSDRADTAASASAERQQTVEDLSADVEALRHQVSGLGEEPVAPDPDERTDDLTPIPGPEGKQGERGPRGFPPTRQQVMNVVVPVVAQYLIENPPPAGADGEDSTIPGPQGEPGADSTVPGPAGADGEDSTIPGPQGEPGEDSTVPGPPGDDGDDGDDGRGIAAVTIEGDGRESCELVVHYDDEDETEDRIGINPLICIRSNEGES
jgi:hypothetical protein